jgi:hypothetical protein
MSKLTAAVFAALLAMTPLWAEDAPAGGDPRPALQALQKEVGTTKAHAMAALKSKTLADLEQAYAEIDALVPKFESWEDEAHKGGWGDEQIEKEQATAGWTALLALVKNLKEEIARQK